MHEQRNDSTATARAHLRAKFAVIFALLTFYLLLASNAFAAGGGAERVGKNLGDLLQTVGSYLTFGVAGLIALGMIASRKFSQIGALLIMAFLVMSLFVAPDVWSNIVNSTMKAIGRGA